MVDLCSSKMQWWGKGKWWILWLSGRTFNLGRNHVLVFVRQFISLVISWKHLQCYILLKLLFSIKLNYFPICHCERKSIIFNFGASNHKFSKLLVESFYYGQTSMKFIYENCNFLQIFSSSLSYLPGSRLWLILIVTYHAA